MTSTDPSRLIGLLSRDGIALDLKTIELCFLAGLYFRADKGALASFDDDTIVDVFEQVCEIVEPAADNPRKRATHAIQRLREQRMLTRVDGAGLVRAGEYALTRLAAAVIDCFIAEEALSRESLTLLTATLRTQLAAIHADAKVASDAATWRQRVITPLSVTVRDLVAGIERRQRGLDTQQEEVQAEIASLLSADWFLAVDRCQTLLEATTGTLRELNEILLRDVHHIIALLQDIQSCASTAEETEAESAVQRVIEHVDRITAWGGARQRAWTEYYQTTHAYLRDVVRLDPDRALSHRMRDQIVRWTSQPFHLLTARSTPICVLRPVERHLERPAVTRPGADREQSPQSVDAEPDHLDIDALVKAQLAAGARSLACITEAILPLVPKHARYAAAGRIAQSVGVIGSPASERERPWTSLEAEFEIEDWDTTFRSNDR